MGVQPLLDAALARRAKLAEKLEKLTDEPAKEGRVALTDDEARKFEKIAGELKDVDKQIDTFRDTLKREEKAAASAGDQPATTAASTAPAVIVSEPRTYDRGGRASFFRDLAAVMIPQAALDGAAERMARHHHELEVDSARDPELRRKLEEVTRTPSGLRQEQRVNPNTSYGQGGEFVPPLWLINQYVPYFRPTRVAANRVQNLPLPPGIDVINLPRITVGSQVAVQGTQGAAVQSVDIQTSTVSARVNTIAGQEDISIQLLEQSPIAMDGVIWDDLSRDYDQRLDVQVIAGTGSNGQHLGVLNVPGVNAVNATSTVFHDGTTAGTQYRSIVNGVNQIETARFAPPTAIWAHPRRTNSWAFASDANGRPLIDAQKYGPWNVLGTNESNPVPQGVAFELFGLQVVKDANMPTALGAGTNQDAVVVLKEDDVYLWEGSMRMRALPEVLSGTLQVRFQCYAYSAFLATRFPASLSVIQGVGTAAPSF